MIEIIKNNCSYIGNEISYIIKFITENKNQFVSDTLFSSRSDLFPIFPSDYARNSEINLDVAMIGSEDLRIRWNGRGMFILEVELLAVEDVELEVLDAQFQQTNHV